MYNKDLATVPFYAFEAVQDRSERVQRRLITALAASLVINIALAALMARKGM